MASLRGSFSYEETAYHLPVTYALTGAEVHEADAGRSVYEANGHSPLIAAECEIASTTASLGHLQPPFTGFIGDAVIRKLGYSLVDGSIVGLALVTGTPPSPDAAAVVCRELQEKLMLTFLSGDTVSALQAAGVKIGLEFRLIPLGPTPLYAVHFTDILARVAMMFGGVIPGDADRLIQYARERAKAIGIVFPGTRRSIR